MKKKVYSLITTILALIMCCNFNFAVSAASENSIQYYNCSNVDYVKYTGLQRNATYTKTCNKYENTVTDTRVVEIRAYSDTAIAFGSGFVVADNKGKSVIATAAHCVFGDSFPNKVEIIVNDFKNNISTVYTADGIHIPKDYYNGTDRGAEKDYAIITVDNPNVSDEYFYLILSGYEHSGTIAGYAKYNTDVSIDCSEDKICKMMNTECKPGQSGAGIYTNIGGTDYILGIVSRVVYAYYGNGELAYICTIGPKVTLDVTMFIAYNGYV